MFRYKAIVEYDGAGFVGWQRQESGLSIQQTIEDAIMSFTFREISVIAAGRTDAGVHAFGQVVHFDLLNYWEPNVFMNAVNHYLKKHKISFLSVELAHPSFHARFDAKEKTYVYKIINRPSRPALEHMRAWHVVAELDIGVMKEAASCLIGFHDFSSFRAVSCQATKVTRTMDFIDVVNDEGMIKITVRSKSFLHNQVRIIVGTLYEIGRGRWRAEKMRQILDAKDRRGAGITAPAYGLYLKSVLYL